MEIIKPVLNIGIEILFMLVIADYAARYGLKKAVKLIVASGFSYVNVLYCNTPYLVYLSGLVSHVRQALIKYIK